MSANFDPLSAGEILAALSRGCNKNRHDINIIYDDEIDSTNRAASELAKQGAPGGTVCVAGRQTSGRGRFGRAYFCPDGGIYLSVILRPESIVFSRSTAVTAFAAVAVCEAIEAISPRKAGIKWVNDIYIDGKKVCGILTEAAIDPASGRISWAVLGIGVNLTVPEGGFPEELRQRAGAVFPGKSPVTRAAFIADLLSRILRHPPENEAETMRAYRSRLIMLGQTVTVSRGNERFEAEVLDVDETGALIVKKDGELMTLSSGEISISL